SDNMCDIWSPVNNKNVDIFLGAYVRTLGVNTNPATNDAKWYIAYDFWDSAGAFIGETKLPIPQTSASSGQWIADTNGVGATILPKDAWKTIVKFVAGKNATGTVWADDFMLYGRGGQWAGQDWNTGVGVPSGWYYWLPPNGGNDGLLNDGFENTMVTSEAAHSGMYSLKFNLPFTRTPHDAFVGTRRFLIDGSEPIPGNTLASLTASEGDVIRLQVWIKASNLVPDSAALYPGTWSVGLTPLWFTTDANNAGYNSVGPSNDYTWAFPAVTQFDWTPYTLDVQVPTGVNAKALEVRLHVYSRFTGTIYFDDLSAQVVQTATGVAGQQGLPKIYELAQNYPNPFNPTTNIQFAVPRESRVVLTIYNILGQKIRSLVDDSRGAGRYEVTWDGKDDHGANVGTGLYLYRLQAGDHAIVRKMLLLK
ncbi:MAG TPA: FlgD immunoglobulin-like domain containing protein, partial [Bacteroidota bacterium]|nr:FlgD immunoglobulin-like domain containing protein [Bacteroidota bacterium]